MLFSFQATIQTTGVWRMSNFGGMATTHEREMPGYLHKQRYGFVRFFGETLNGCTAKVVGYQNHTVAEFALPGSVLIELPCSVEVQGPAGLTFLVEAWEVDSFSHRGAKRSLFAPGSADFVSGEIPDWASSFDAQGDGGLFYSDAGLITPVGTFAANVSNVSIPQGARFVRMPASGTSNNPKGITFRQL